MHYREYIPSAPLRQFIDTFWIAKNDENVAESRILPDGFMDIVFDINHESAITDTGIRISGMMTTYRDIISLRNAETIGVRFKPGQMGLLADFQFSSIKNKTVVATELSSMLNNILLEELNDKPNVIEKFKLIESVLINHLGGSNTSRNRIIPSVCETISEDYQSIDMLKVARQHHISLRQLERRFKAAVGVTMKEYHAIVRFNKTLQSISHHPRKSLMESAFDNGYFDHAHLTKNFFKMAGLNPSQL